MAKKSLQQCRSGKDFVRYAEKAGARIENGKGSHAKVYNDKGIAIVPRHNNDLGKGLRFTLIKTFVKMGIVLLFFNCVVVNVILRLVHGVR